MDCPVNRISPRLLVITRNFPPQTGGLENYSFNLIRELRRHLPVRVIALGRRKHHLLWFLPYALLAGLFYACLGNTSRIHLCDGLLAPIGCILKFLASSRVSISVHGLDVTYGHPFYQRLIPFCMRRLDLIVCVSRATRAECLNRGIPRSRCVVVPNGIHPAEIHLADDRGDLVREVEAALGRSLQGKKILLTVGRLVKRKGVAWFIEDVLPQLGAEYVYVVVGNGPELSAIQSAAKRCGLAAKVILVGRGSDRLRNCLLNIAHAFIMPNITIPGDVEGFGIAALEAGACGLPVIASGIQGIRDAVIDGVTGHLVPERSPQAFADRIAFLDLDRSLVRTAVAERFGWERIGMEYVLKLTSDEMAYRV